MYDAVPPSRISLPRSRFVDLAPMWKELLGAMPGCSDNPDENFFILFFIRDDVVYELKDICGVIPSTYKKEQVEHSLNRFITSESIKYTGSQTSKDCEPFFF